jgi:hypothetical protein
MATTKQRQTDITLYDRDYYSWALEQARALREHRIEELDWENLAEEVGDLARSERRAFRSQCARLVEHLLKLAFSTPMELRRNQRLWRLSLIAARSELADLLTESPGLRPSAGELFESGWKLGRIEALKSVNVPEDVIPDSPLWQFDQAVDEAFLPSTETR